MNEEQGQAGNEKPEAVDIRLLHPKADPWKNPQFRTLMENASRWHRKRTGRGMNNREKFAHMAGYNHMRIAHWGQFREYGIMGNRGDILKKSSIDHCLQVAIYVARAGGDMGARIGAMNHDSIEDNPNISQKSLVKYLSQSLGKGIKVKAEQRQLAKDAATIVALVSHPKLTFKYGQYRWIHATDPTYSGIIDEYENEKERNPLINSIRHREGHNHILMWARSDDPYKQRIGASALAIKLFDVYEDMEDLIGKPDVPIDVKVRRLGKVGNFLRLAEEARTVGSLRTHFPKINFASLFRMATAYRMHLVRQFSTLDDEKRANLHSYVQKVVPGEFLMLLKPPLLIQRIPVHTARIIDRILSIPSARKKP